MYMSGSLPQVAILKMDAVRDFCKIQRLIVHDKSKMPVKKKSFIGGIKECMVFFYLFLFP